MVKFLCDRCGKETSHGFTIMVPPKKKYDLCEECTDKFSEFMRGDQK